MLVNAVHGLMEAIAVTSSKVAAEDILKALLGQTGPVPNCRSQEAAMDVVEFLRIRPVGFNIVNLEADIRGNPLSISAQAKPSDDRQYYQRG